jgi:glutamate formiminotransferase
MLECVVNLSEGRRPEIVREIAAGAVSDLLDVHLDAQHNRSVLTLAGSESARLVAARAVDRLDLRTHEGVHPRIGVVDVVPFVPLDGDDLTEALAARDAFATWFADGFGVPCFVYGPERSLPEVRRGAFGEIGPDYGPSDPHPTAGACAVGARGILVAYNLWLRDADLATAREIARSLRGPAVRALGLAVGESVQVSMNLIAPDAVGPADVYDRVATCAEIERAELVGLVPTRILAEIDPRRWSQLDLGEDRTIEARLALRR